MEARVKVLVRGIVQGVGFRAFIARHARALGLRGYVRNLPDGYSVELVAEGPREALEKLIALARRGPPGARVEDVEVEWGEARGDFRGFQIG